GLVGSPAARGVFLEEGGGIFPTAIIPAPAESALTCDGRFLASRPPRRFLREGDTADEQGRKRNHDELARHTVSIAVGHIPNMLISCSTISSCSEAYSPWRSSVKVGDSKASSSSRASGVGSSRTHAWRCHGETAGPYGSSGSAAHQTSNA